MAKWSTSLFSLQPKQGGGLTAFKPYGADLEHTGSMQEFIDPSLTGGEGLSLDPSEEPLDPSTLEQGEDGEYRSTTTGTQFSLPDDDELNAPRQPGGRRTSQVTGSQDTLSEDQRMILNYLDKTQTGLKWADKLSGALAEPETETSTATGAQTSTSDFLRSGGATGDLASLIASDPAQLDDFIKNLNLRTSGGLEGSAWNDLLGGAEGEEKFDLGFDSKLSDPTSPEAQKSIWDQFGLKDVQGVLGVGQAAVTGDPAKILPALNKLAPNVAKYLTDNTEAINQVGNVSNALGGAYQLAVGIQSQNPAQIAGGLGQLLNGAGGVVGLETISQLTGVSTGALTNALGVIGGVTGAFNLVNAIQSGDPVQALMGAVSVYGALSTVAPGVFTPLTQLATQAVQAVANAVGAGAGATSALSSISAAAGPILGVAAVVVMAVVSWVGANEESEARRSGWWNNPIAGGLYSAASEGIGNTKGILDQIDQAGGISRIPTDQLLRALPSIVGGLQPYFAAAQGGAGALTPDITPGSPGTQTKEEYHGNYVNARDRVTALVKDLLARGVTYEQLGQIEMGGDWAYAAETAGGRPWDTLMASPRRNELMGEGSYLYSQSGLPTGPSGISNQEFGAQSTLLRQALGASMDAPEEVSKAAGSLYDMYGGELWTALHRMGVPDQDIQNMILSRFDPWVNARKWAPGSRIGEHHVTDVMGQPLFPEEWGQGVYTNA